MKQLFIQHGRPQIEKIPRPLINDMHVLVEVAYSLISTGTELSGVQQSSKSLLRKVLDQPEKVLKVVEYLRGKGFKQTVAKIQQQTGGMSPMGYSCSGIVIEVGAGISDLQLGDRVACAGAGIANHAEIVLVPRNLVTRVPDKCGLREAASVTLGSIAMQGVRRADPRLGEMVAVIGLGLLGQITMMLLKASGCRVIGFDLDPRRLEIAQRLGLDMGLLSGTDTIENEIRQFTGDHGVDCTIITAASESDAIVQQAMQITRKKGRVVVVGAVGLGIKRAPFYEKELDFLISCSYGPGRYDARYEKKGLDYPYAYVRWTEQRNMAEYLHLIAEGKLDVGVILEREYALKDAEKAYADLQLLEEKPLGVLFAYGLVQEEAERTDKLVTNVVLRVFKPDGKINVAVVGAGNFAKATHLPNLLKLADMYHLRAVVSATGSNARMTAQQFGADYASTDYDDVLADETVDMVVICTRHHLHASMAAGAARAGKAILLEKPMALNMTELEELSAVLEETQVPFMVGFNRRFSPAAQQAKRILADDSVPLMMLYRVNAGYLPREHWTQTEEGGGRIVGEACHMLDMFQYLVGPGRVVEIESQKLTPRQDHILAQDNVSTSIRYDDGSLATLIYTSLGSADLPKEVVEIYAGGKVLVIDDYRELKLYGTTTSGWHGKRQDKGQLEELHQFGKYVCGECEAPISLESMITTTRLSFTIEKGCE